MIPDRTLHASGATHHFATPGAAIRFSNGARLQLRPEGQRAATSRRKWIEASLWERPKGAGRIPEGRRGADVILSDPHIETWQKKDQTTGFKLVGKVS